MNKRSRKTKGFSRILIAWLLCCVCLIGAVPIQAIALGTEAATTTEQTEKAPVEPEVTDAVTPAPMNLSDSADASGDVDGSDPEMETPTGSTKEPVTENTTESETETTTESGTETTTESAAQTNGGIVASPAPEGMETQGASQMPTTQAEENLAPASIGGVESITLEIGGTQTITSTVTSSTYWNHPESWKSDNEAVATVEYTANILTSFKAPTATVTGVSAGTATITHTYYTSSGRWNPTYTEHTETITVIVKAPVVYTVTFDIGEEAVNAGLVPPDSVKVLEGQTVANLPVLSWKNEGGQYVKVFGGWYADAELKTEFTSTTAVVGDTTLYAKWLAPDADDVYYVNFYSQDGGTVHLTLSALEGKTVAPAQGPTLVGKLFRGWSTEMQDNRPVAELQPFDFTTAISEAELDKDGKTLNLYAWYAKSVNVNFVANGGTAVPSQTIAEGETATIGQTTRTGYTFRGWSTDKDNYVAFDFATLVNDDLTLYAFWDAALVPVTIVYMYENANDDGYSPAGASDKVYAPAGSYVSIEKNGNITDTNGRHAVRYADTVDGTLTGYAKQSANANGNNATIQDVRGTYFQYESATNRRWVNPDGSTTVLVYYNRARVTLTFNYDRDKTTASIDYLNLISKDNRTKYAVSYSQNGESKFTYSFTAKYGEDITAVWPQVAWVKDNSTGGTPSYTNNRQTYTFYGWDTPGSDSVQVSNMYTLESDLFSGTEIKDGKLVGTGNITEEFEKTSKYWLIYARTTLPGETVDFTYNGNNYTIYKEACQMAYAAAYFGSKSLDGCEPVYNSTDSKKFTANYSDSMSMSNLTAQNGTLKAKFDGEFPRQISQNDKCQVLLYKRSTLSLNVWTYAENYSDPQKASYYYGDKIYNEDTDLLRHLEATMKKDGYIFAGWYSSSEFTPGTEYNPDENSTITGNMNLYAKWEPNQFRAEYYLYMDDAEPYATQGFAEGGKIDDKLVPSAVQGSFLGWYWYQNGQLVPFDFTSAVGANHVDKDGVLKLYAKWSGTNGLVSYLPGIGGDNANQEVFDDRDFAINEASVQMPLYTTVWKDGSVPSESKLTFVGWKAPNGAIYQPGRYVLVTRNLMQFEAQWSRDAVKLIYNANGGEGSNVTENWARNSVVTVWDNMDGTTPHFTREGFKLLGWDTNPNATTPTYPLGQGNITLTEDETTLYAIWKLNEATLTVQKTVSGNMYDVNKAFPFTIAYDGKSERFELKANEVKTFQVPVGVEVTVTEDLTASNGYIPGVGTGTTVKLTGTIQSDGIFKFTMPEQNGTLVINNEKNVTVDTGISLETVPYILILALVVVGVFLLMKRRSHRYDD